VTEPIRVLQLCASLTAGGAERLIHGLARTLDRRHFTVHVCALSVVGGNAFQQEFDRDNIPVYVVGARKMFDPRMYIKLIRYIRENNIQIIHTHLTNADFVGRIVGKILGIPVVSTMHNIPKDYDMQKSYAKVLEKFTAQHAVSHLIAVSERIRQLFIQEWRIPAQTISTITNGVPLNDFLPVPEGVIRSGGQQGPVITTIGRLTPQKAQHIFIEAAAHIVKAYPDASFQIVGRGHLENELKALAQKLGIAEQVQFAGVRHDIPNILAASDIFVLSSAWEGLPVTAIEAMAAARPVVLTDVGGIRDLVESGKHGFIVPPHNAQALADALLELLREPQKAQAMGLAGRTHVQKAFSMELFARNHEQLYTTIVRQQHG
jgi:glycosyltransferase involved in cell wall biosynthesis